jgi:alkylation response protein AidB-like acyl-CoA dehydrogenase
MEFESPAKHCSKSMGLTADDPATDWVLRAREYAPELAAAADEIERRRGLPEPVVATLAERGFFRLLLPRLLGGAELLPARFVPVIEEIAKADASATWCLNQAAGCAMTVVYLGPAAVCEIFGKPRGILAWVVLAARSSSARGLITRPNLQNDGKIARFGAYSAT